MRVPCLSLSRRQFFLTPLRSVRYTLSEEVEESPRGIANMCQLHMIRAFGCAPSVTRPLLCPDKAIKVTPPVIRIIESKRYFTGKFFNERTACQCDDCILVVFPKSHRGDVRLQVGRSFVWLGSVRRLCACVCVKMSVCYGELLVVVAVPNV